jgi:RND family efflux transporter MFP subunit
VNIATVTDKAVGSPVANDDTEMRVRQTPSRRRYAIAAFILVVGALLWFLARPSGDPMSQDGAAPSLTVSVASPQVENWSDTLVASGAVAAWQEASIGTQIGGFQINDVLVNVGDQVRKGQVLAILNPALLRADEAQLMASQEQAQANRQRALSLKASGAISDQDVLQNETAARTADALLAAKRLQLRYTIVRAPDDGVISARAATIGAVAPVGQELFRLIRRNRLEWRGELDAVQLATITAGQTVSLSLPDGRIAAATVRQVAPMLDDRSRLGIVYADIAPDSHARAGMYATGRIVVGRSAARTVPAAGIVVRDGRSYVIKITGRPPTSKVAKQLVAVGRRQGDRVEIVRGLGSSDRIVVTGADFLDDGDLVRIAQTASGSIRP